MTIPKHTADDSGDAQRGQKKPFSYQEAYELQAILAKGPNLHYVCLFMVAVDSMLRCSDVIKLKVHHVRYASGRIRQTLALKQQKSQNNVRPVLSPETQSMCRQWIKQSSKDQSDYLFTGEKNLSKTTPIYHTTYRYHAKKWARQLGLEEEEYSTHSMRRVKPHYLYYECGVDIDDIRELMGHEDIRTTRTYLRISTLKAQEAAIKNNLFSKEGQKPPKPLSLNDQVAQLNKEVRSLKSMIKQLLPLASLAPHVQQLIDYQNSMWSPP